MEEVKVTGTFIWYYYICKREVWLISHGIVADQDNENMEIGRYIHENSYNRIKKEIEVSNLRFDILDKEDGKIVIGEIKKSSKFKESAKMQLAYYLLELKKSGIEAKGVIMFPTEKKRETVELTSKLLEKLKKDESKILEIIYSDKPIEPKKIVFCNKCAYNEFCWS